MFGIWVSVGRLRI